MLTTVTRRRLLGTGAALAAAPLARRARAQGRTRRVKLGVLNDQSGPYRDVTGATSVACLRQAVEEFGSQGGFEVEVVAGDHQNKPDIGLSIARQWFDQDGVDAIFDVPTSSVALAVNTIARDKNKIYVNTGGATVDLTGKDCTPVTVHWAYDTYMLASSTAGSLAHSGGDTWFFITADYVFGHQLQHDATAIVEKAGGKVLGSAAYPFPGTTDFSSFLVQAQASGAKVIGLANAGHDTVNCVKQAREFGLLQNGKTRLAALLGSLNVIHGLGLAEAQGLLLTESFYWDLNDRTRAFMARLRPKTPDNYPNAVQAACYSGGLHVLRSIAALGADRAGDGAAVVARMKAVPADDDAFGRTTIRADGRAMVPAYLFRVKAPAESRGEWDLYDPVATTAPEDAAPPVSACPLVRS